MNVPVDFLDVERFIIGIFFISDKFADFQMIKLIIIIFFFYSIYKTADLMFYS